jgi:hypothetical protein
MQAFCGAGNAARLGNGPEKNQIGEVKRAFSF